MDEIVEMKNERLGAPETEIWQFCNAHFAVSLDRNVDVTNSVLELSKHCLSSPLEIYSSRSNIVSTLPLYTHLQNSISTTPPK
jgi:hypothetical protein